VAPQGNVSLSNSLRPFRVPPAKSMHAETVLGHDGKYVDLREMNTEKD